MISMGSGINMTRGTPSGRQSKFGSSVMTLVALNLASAHGSSGGSPFRYILGWNLRSIQTPVKSGIELAVWVFGTLDCSAVLAALACQRARTALTANIT